MSFNELAPAGTPFLHFISCRNLQPRPILQSHAAHWCIREPSKEGGNFFVMTAWESCKAIH